MSLTAIDGISLTARAHRLLRDEIVVGLRAPGELLDDRELAERYQVRPPAVRLACTMLVRDGFVVSLPERRHAVAPIDLKELHQAYEVRLMVEPSAAGLAAERVDEENARLLRQAVVERPLGSEHADCLEALAADRAFHVQVARASGNARLVELVDTLLSRSERYLHLTVHGDGIDDDPVESHRELVDAILGGDRADAEFLARHHVTCSRRRAIEGLMRERAAARLRLRSG